MKPIIAYIKAKNAGGSPKGTYATVSALQTAFPTGSNNIYLVTADGNWYYWSGSAWTAGGVYQATQVPNKTITPVKTNFFKTGKNLFNKDTVTVGYYVNNSNGVLAANANYNASDFIEIEANVSYFTSHNYYLAFYDVNKVYISGLANGHTATFATPANAFYVRVSVAVADVNTFQLEKGTAGTTYESFKYLFDVEKFLEKNSINKDLLADKSVTKQKTDFVTVGKNKFNKETVTIGYYVSNGSGALAANASYNASDWIEVEPNTSYFTSHNYYSAFYDENKAFISGLANGHASTFTSPANAKYFRASIPVNSTDVFQVEKGSVGTTYEPFQYELKDVTINATDLNDDVLVFLPSEICVAVGRTIELYNRQVIWTGNMDNIHVAWTCSVGKAYKRKWTVTGTTIGEYALTLNVYDNNMKLLATASTTVKVVSNVIENPIDLLNIGDSLTNGKPWLAELRSLSSDKIKMVGTRWNGDVQGGNLNHEGRSGATAAWYLANSTYDFEANGAGTGNPLWNPSTSAFDYTYYKTTYGINPNAIQIFLGTNGISLDPTTNANNIKAIVDGIRASDATIPIFLVFTLYRGDQNGIANTTGSDGYIPSNGVWKLEEDRKVFNLMVRLNELLKSYTNLHFVPIALEHDSEYNFGSVTNPVNPRSSITELMPTEATHPQTSGYYQFADTMFSVICKVF